MAKKYPEAITHYPKSMQIFIKKITNRIESGRNALIVVIGQTGSGKSLSTLSLLIGLYLYSNGKMPTKEYLIETHCLFKATDFLEAMNNPELEKKDKWIWDEAGVDVGHKDHASTHNKVIGWLAQTFRNLQQVVFFTVPSLAFIDASVRKLIHYQLETRSINKATKICYIKPLEMQYNNREDKIYFHNINIQNRDGFYDEIDVMGVPIPPKDFVELYEQRKMEFTRKLNQKIHAMLQRRDKEDNFYIKHGHKKLYVLWHKGIKKQNEMAKIIGVTPRSISSMLQTMDKEYVDWRENSSLLGTLITNDKNNKEIPLAQLNSQSSK